MTTQLIGEGLCNYSYLKKEEEFMLENIVRIQNGRPYVIFSAITH